MHKIEHSQLRKAPPVFMAVVVVLLASVFYRTAYAYPVPQLPEDNLIVNPWFRDLGNPSMPGFDGWARPLNEGVTWGPSQKESNPSPDIVVSGTCGFQQIYCGTAARWAEQAGVLYPYVDVYAYQAVATDPAHRKLKFFAHYVSHLVEVGQVSVYAGESPEGPWELVWVPIHHTEDKLIVPESGESRDLWQETGFLEKNLDQGYPYYKIELQSRLPESPVAGGIRGVGFKITGVYFSTAFTDEPGEPRPTPGQPSPPTPTVAATAEISAAVSATPTMSLADPTVASNSVAEIETETNDQDVTTLTAEPISPTEIILVWSEGRRSNRGFRLERSLDMTTGWRSIAALEPGLSKFTDSGLPPDTVYYYRLRVSQDEISDVVSARTLSLPESPPVAPATLRAQSTTPSQVELKWSDLSGDEDGYEVERSLDGLAFTQIKTLGPDTASFVDADLDPSVYYYRVRSYRENTFSEYSEVVRIEVRDRRQEGDGEAATGGEAEQTSAPEVSEAPATTAPAGRSSLAILGLVFVTLLVGIGLGMVLTRRRT